MADALLEKLQQEHAGSKRKAEPAVGAIGKFEELHVDVNACGVLNAANSDVLKSVLHGGDGDAVMKSDCDEQLLLTVSFPGPVKIHSVVVEGGDAAGPKTVKLFANRNNMTFDDCEDKPTQEITLGGGAPSTQPLTFVKFQNVSSLSVFIEDNVDDDEVTTLRSLKFIGAPLATTNMNDLKKGG